MPSYTLEHKGQSYTLEAPNEQAALEAFNSVVVRQAKPEQSYGAGAADAFTQGLTFGFGDELTALEAGVFGKTPEGGWFDYSKSFGDRYHDALNAERGQQKEYRQENPKTAFAAEMAGGIATGTGLAKQGISAIAKTAGKPLATRAAAGLKEGAAYGTAYGAGNAEGNENIIGDALKGGMTGAVIGGSIPYIGESLKRGAGAVRNFANKRLNPTGSQQQAGIDLVKRYADNAGMSVDDLVDGVREGRVIAQQDEQLGRLAKSIQQQPGPARKAVRTALNQGYDDVRQTAQDDVAGAMNAEPNFYKWLDNFKTAKRENANTAYNAVFSQNWGPKGPPMALDNIMKSGRIPASAMREAVALAKIEGRPFGKTLIASIDDAADEVTFARLPSLEEAEIIRRGLKSATSKAYSSGSATGGALRDLERDLRNIIDGSSDGLRRVRAQYATASQIQDAAELGLRLGNKSADEIEFMLEDMAPDAISAMRKAFASDLKAKIEKGDLTRDTVRNLFGNKRARRILGMMWPDQDEFNTFQRQMENSAEFNAMRSRVLGGSDTAENLYHAGDLTSGSLIGAAGRTLRGDVGGLVDIAMQLGMKSLNPAKGLPPEQLRRAAEILVERDPALAHQLLTRVSNGDAKAINMFARELDGLIGKYGTELQRQSTVGLISGM